MQTLGIVTGGVQIDGSLGDLQVLGSKVSSNLALEGVDKANAEDEIIYLVCALINCHLRVGS
ncbi:hypothetical protein D3C76_1826620 [compost metagenome]